MDPLATVDELETHLGRDVDADQAQQWLELASGAVRAYCGWNLAREETTFYFEGTGTSLITLPTLELISVEEVRANGTAVDADTIVWSRQGQGHTAGSCWLRRTQYAVDVTHGYDPVPDLLRLVTLDLASRQVHNPMGLVSATVGQVSRTWSSGSSADPGALSALHERLLDRYRL